MQEMTRGYVLHTLREEHLWENGQTDTFEVMLSQKWEFTLRREEKEYLPYKYSLTGKKIETNETWSRRYISMEEAFLHIVNRLNENVMVEDKYTYVEDWLLENK